MKNLKFAVVGSGAVGCYYGGRLARQGAEVHFLMRGDLEAVRERGLTIRSGPADENGFHLANVNAHGAAAGIGPSDVVLIALKTTSNAALEYLLPPLLKPETRLVTLQNGLGNEEFLAERFGAGRVLGGICFVCLNRSGPGVVEHLGHGSLSLGEFGRSPLARTFELAEEFRRAGIEARAVESLIAERWRKLVWNIPFNGLSIAAGGLDVGKILADENLRAVARQLMAEVVEAAGLLGHPIPPAFIEEQLQRTLPMGPYRPSSLIDYNLGREIEVESIWGEPCRRALAAGASVPRLQMLHALVKSLASARRLSVERGES